MMSKAVCHSLYAFCMSMLHSVFVSFYIDYFIRKHLLIGDVVGHGNNVLAKSEAAQRWAMLFFILCQILYAGWHAMSELAMGWLIDRQLQVRTIRLWFGGPMLALCFALAWMPLRIPFVHPALSFTFRMAAYDGFYSYCVNALRVLLEGDMGSSPLMERAQCSARAASSSFYALGSIGVGVASYLYESSAPSTAASDGLTYFRIFTTLWAALAAIGFTAIILVVVMGSKSRKGSRIKQQPSDAYLQRHNTSLREGAEGSLSASECVAFAAQTTSRRSIQAVMGVWTLQAYSCTLATSFFSIFLAVMCADSISRSVRALLLLMSFAVPHGITLLSAPMYATMGKKRVFAMFLAARLCVGVFLCVLSVRLGFVVSYSSSDNNNNNKYGDAFRQDTVTFALLLFLNRVLTEAVTRMQPLIVSDVTDEDTVIFGRNRPMAAATHSLVSAISKPFHSLAVILTCVFLSYWEVLPQRVGSSTTMTKMHRAPHVAAFMGLNAVVTSAAMLAVWMRWYNLDGKHLQFIQMALRKRTEEAHVETV